MFSATPLVRVARRTTYRNAACWLVAAMFAASATLACAADKTPKPSSKATPQKATAQKTAPQKVAAKDGAAQKETGPKSSTQNAKRDQAIAKAIDYLRTQGQAEDGSYSKQAGPAITAIVTAALMRHGRTIDDPQVAKGLKYLVAFVQEDGAISEKDSSHKNYETCVAIMCLRLANKDGRYDKVLKQSEGYVRKEQWDQQEGKQEDDLSYGGAGYGGAKRPDLSNTSFLVDALHESGAGADDEAIKKALVFISRCQNLEGEHNTTEFAAKINDGGFYYTVAAGGASIAGKEDNGGLRSYGSMTYAGLKSMIFAGLSPDDPRVKAAFEWAQKHYDVNSNPGMGKAGLYYYYHTFAKALDAMKVDKVKDAEGHEHDWRAELTGAILARQKPNGSWVNEDKRFLESDSNLVTGYALLALSYCEHK